jgi:hypothetical protein
MTPVRNSSDRLGVAVDMGSLFSQRQGIKLPVAKHQESLKMKSGMGQKMLAEMADINKSAGCLNKSIMVDRGHVNSS